MNFYAYVQDRPKRLQGVPIGAHRVAVSQIVVAGVYASRIAFCRDVVDAGLLWVASPEALSRTLTRSVYLLLAEEACGLLPPGELWLAAWPMLRSQRWLYESGERLSDVTSRLTTRQDAR